jgi:Tfp pilus assembly protein PilX
MWTLALLAMFGMFATTTSTIESQVTGNDRRHKIAFYASELALITGEVAVETLPSRAALQEDATPGHYAKGTLPAWHDLVWDNTDSVVIAAVPAGLNGAAAAPRYTIEEQEFRRDSLKVGMGMPTGVYRFNVVTRGGDASNTAQSVLQTIYAKRFN